MPLYIGDYLGDTLSLTRENHGSYLLLIMAYWKNGGPLLAEDESLASIAKCDPVEWQIVKPVLLRFFKEENGFWYHKRVEEELEKSRVQYAKKQNQTAAALRARGIVTSNVTSNVTNPVTVTQPQPPSQSHYTQPPGQCPTKEMALNWLEDWRKNGATYTQQEMESAFLALQANGWMWGKNPVVDFRAALERQIQTDRNNKKPISGQSFQDKERQRQYDRQRYGLKP